MVLLPSGKLQDQNGKSVPSLGAKFGMIVGMIYTALVGFHMICATLAKSSFRVSDSFEIKCIRWGQMGSPTGIRQVSSKSCGKPGQPNIPPLYSKVQNTCYTDGVSGWRSWIDKCFPGFAKSKNKLLLISDGRKAELILLALLSTAIYMLRL